jgi:2-oxoglutarate ferredoxin oxidoreductase subunit gamma
MSVEPVHHEVLIAGFGGQGVVLAGRLLAMAALAEGRQLVWAPSYGPEMRGGAVHCTVIISSERIGSPEVSLADSLVIMDQASLERLSRRVKPGGLFVLNSSLITDRPACDECQIVSVAANDAAEELGERRVANVVMLGALLARRPVVSPESLAGAIRTLGPMVGAEALIPVNLQALERGMALAQAGV